MATELSRFNILSQLTAKYTNTSGGGETPVAAQQVGFIYEPATAFTDGTGDFQADVWAEDRNRAMTGVETIEYFLLDDSDNEFASPSGTPDGSNILGLAHGFAEVTHLIVRNQSASTGNLVFGGDTGGEQWLTGPIATVTHNLVLKPGVTISFASEQDGDWAIAGGADLLKVVSTGNLVFDLIIMGRSA